MKFLGIILISSLASIWITEANEDCYENDECDKSKCCLVVGTSRKCTKLEVEGDTCDIHDRRIYHNQCKCAEGLMCIPFKDDDYGFLRSSQGLGRCRNNTREKSSDDKKPKNPGDTMCYDNGDCEKDECCIVISSLNRRCRKLESEANSCEIRKHHFHRSYCNCAEGLKCIPDKIEKDVTAPNYSKDLLGLSSKSEEEISEEDVTASYSLKDLLGLSSKSEEETSGIGTCGKPESK